MQKHISSLLLADKPTNGQKAFFLEEDLHAAQQCIAMTDFWPGALGLLEKAPNSWAWSQCHPGSISFGWWKGLGGGDTHGPGWMQSDSVWGLHCVISILGAIPNSVRGAGGSPDPGLPSCTVL